MRRAPGRWTLLLLVLLLAACGGGGSADDAATETEATATKGGLGDVPPSAEDLQYLLPREDELGEEWVVTGTSSSFANFTGGPAGCPGLAWFGLTDHDEQVRRTYQDRVSRQAEVVLAPWTDDDATAEEIGDSLKGCTALSSVVEGLQATMTLEVAPADIGDEALHIVARIRLTIPQVPEGVELVTYATLLRYRTVWVSLAAGPGFNNATLAVEQADTRVLDHLAPYFVEQIDRLLDG